MPKPNISPSPSSGGFRPGGFRPGGARAAGLRPGGASSAAGGDTSPTKSNAENVNANTNGDSARKPIIYSKQMLLSLRDEEYCVCRPDDLVDLTVRSGEQAGRRQSSSHGNYGGDNRRGDGRQGGGGDEWSRGMLCLLFSLFCFVFYGKFSVCIMCVADVLTLSHAYFLGIIRHISITIST